MKILAVTSMRNEGPYCLEWIAHHRAAGFSDFLIYTHNCDDGTDALLDLIPGVTHVPFAPDPDKSPQWSAMRQANQHPLMKDADWVMFFDCDEYLCLQAPLSTVQGLISALPESTDAVALQWRLFGSSGHIDWEIAPTLSRFEWAAPAEFTLPAGHFFKTLFRPEKFQKLGVHRPKNSPQKDLAEWRLGGTDIAPAFFAENDNRINMYGLSPKAPLAWLNHYSIRSVTEFMIKRERGLPNRKTKKIHLGYWAERNFNIVRDNSISHMLKATFEQLEILTNHNHAAQIVEDSMNAHRQVFHNALKKREAVMLFLHLSLLSSSTPPDMKRIQTHLARLNSAQ